MYQCTAVPLCTNVQQSITYQCTAVLYVPMYSSPLCTNVQQSIMYQCTAVHYVPMTSSPLCTNVQQSFMYQCTAVLYVPMYCSPLRTNVQQFSLTENAAKTSCFRIQLSVLLLLKQSIMTEILHDCCKSVNGSF